MPTYHDVIDALPVGSAANKALLRAAIIKRTALCLAAAEDLQTITVVDLDAGTIPLYVIQNGRLFEYDSADSTTAHDVTTCLVSADGKRYKVDTFVTPFSVLDKDLTAPPVSPAIGDAYLAAAASTGAWAGHDFEIPVYTARGWEFVTPPVGFLIYVEDEGAYYHIDAAGDLVAGFGVGLQDGSVPAKAMVGGIKSVITIVENQTTNTPPAIVEGTNYVIGFSPTGRWAGHAGKIARGENGTENIYAPTEGVWIFDKANDGPYYYSGTAWVSSFGQFTVTRRVYSSSTTWNKPARLFMVNVVACIGGGGGESASAGTGGTSSFGAHCSATGGAGEGGAPGAGSGGTTNLTGARGSIFGGGGAAGPFGAPTVTGETHLVGLFPGGGAVGDFAGADKGGSGGGHSDEIIVAASLGSSETVTVGAGGTSGGGGALAGAGGVVIVDEYVFA